jgi:hypothetical protein
MAARTVYYFCSRQFRRGIGGDLPQIEMVCKRLAPYEPVWNYNDHMAALEKEYYSKGQIHKITYPARGSLVHDLAWEEEQIRDIYRGDVNNVFHKLTVKNQKKRDDKGKMN